MPEPIQLLQTRRGTFVDLAQRIASCELCPRLRKHCREIARTKRRAYLAEDYWGRPVPGFGDPDARLLIIGLAPAAHGANRTGRMFTGDASGSWLYEALHRFGWANRPDTTGPGDGLRLDGVYVAASARCAPPGNRPTPAELGRCRPYLVEELRLLRKIRLVLCLGRIAFDAYLAATAEAGAPWPRPRPSFGHGAVHEPPDGGGHSENRGGPPSPAPVPGRGLRHRIVTSYHPSRQNTQTGRLTRAMWHEVFQTCSSLLAEDSRL